MRGLYEGDSMFRVSSRILSTVHSYLSTFMVDEEILV